MGFFSGQSPEAVRNRRTGLLPQEQPERPMHPGSEQPHDPRGPGKDDPVRFLGATQLPEDARFILRTAAQAAAAMHGNDRFWNEQRLAPSDFPEQKVVVAGKTERRVE